MRTTSFCIPVSLATLFLLPLLAAAQTKTPPKAQGKPAAPKEIIITDDVMMLDAPLRGAEQHACCPYPSGRNIEVGAGRHERIAWQEGKSAGDTLRLIRLEIRKAGAIVAQLTLSLRSGSKKIVMQCMKGFGCEKGWEAYPWKSKDGNFLEHPTHRFRIAPDGADHFRIQNLDESVALSVRVNPCTKPVKTQSKPSKRH
jgi:hypothetical protein